MNIMRNGGFIKIILIYLICFTCLIPTIPSYALDTSPYAEALDILGLFQGTNEGYQLDRVPSRSEILVMIIRLLGKEREAVKASYPHPFKDTSWDDPYVGYGYKHGIVRGISSDSFGGNREATLKQYCTMLLRVLGYDDSSGDFTYEYSIDFAELVLGERIDKGDFRRRDMVKLTCYGLKTRKKNSSKTLAQYLVEEGIFSQQELNKALRLWEEKESYESTTVLIYAIGSDLESQQGRLTRDLEEILRAAPKENCHVLLQTGGTIKYHNDWMTDGRAERFAVVGREIHRIEANIDTAAYEAKTLRDFILWGVKEAPAQRYMLVLWDHGYGIKRGFGADELNERRSMPVSEIRKAIAEAGVYFHIIAFDACLMGTVETAYALRNHARYLIASEIPMPACGLYYTTWISALEHNPNISTERLGRAILDSFTIHAGIEANVPTSLSMMDLNRVDILIDHMAHYAGDLINAAKSGESLGKDQGVLDQFDLLSVMNKDPEITAAVQALAYELRNSIDDGRYCGLALYVPVYKPEDSLYMREELKRIGLGEDYLNKIFKK